MCKPLVFVCAFICWIGMAMAQPTLRVASVETPRASQVAIPVQLYDIFNMEGVQLGLEWEGSELQLDSVGFSPDYPMLNENFTYPTPNELVFNWEIDYWETVRNGDTLFLMYFSVLKNCGLAAIQRSTTNSPFRISRGGQDIAGLVFLPGGVDVPTYERISRDTTVCQGDTFELFVEAPLATSLNWSGTDGILSCTDCPRPTVTELYGEATFTVEIAGPAGCADTAFVYVNSRSYLDFGLLLFSNSPVCVGDTIYFDPNVSGGQSYQWSGPQGFQSTEWFPRLAVTTLDQAGSYTLDLVDQYGCEAGATFDVIVGDTIRSVEVNFQDGACEGGPATMEIGAIEGGQGPFTYQINGSDPLPIPDGPFEVAFFGNIDLLITSVNGGCAWRRSFFRPHILGANIIELQAPPCQGPDFDGALFADIEGGTLPFAFTWTTAATTQSIDGLGPGEYGVTVTDDNGCSATATYTLEPSPIDSIRALPSLMVAGDTSRLEVFGKNFSSLSWSPAALLDNPNSATPRAINLLETTTFTVSVEDQMGCFDEASVVVTIQQPALTWTIVDSLSAGQSGIWCDPTLNPLGLNLTIDEDCIDHQGEIFEAQIGALANCLEYTAVSPGTDSLCFISCLNNTDICGPGRLFVSVAPEEDPVWPGDTNDDGSADQYDVLNFGFILDSLRGPQRPLATLDWTAQTAFDWPRQTAEAVNNKHIDTDGNGVIDIADTLALHHNWGLVHDGFVPGTPIDERSGIPFSIRVDTLQAGQSYALPVKLGTTDYPAEDVYGLAFQLTYDPNYVVPGSVRFSADGSWLGEEGQDLLLMQREFSQAGRLAIGMTRLDGNNMNGSGIIGYLYITIEDDILLRNHTIWEKSGLDFSIEIEGVKLISNAQDILPVEIVDVDVELITDLRTISQELSVTIFPIPAKETLWIKTATPQKMWGQIFDTQGRQLKSFELNVGHDQLDVQDLRTGFYWVRLWNGDGVVLKKVLIGG